MSSHMCFWVESHLRLVQARCHGPVAAQLVAMGQLAPNYKNYIKSFQVQALIYTTSAVASPKFLGEQTFDFRRAIVYRLGHHPSKHKMTRYAKNVGGSWLPVTLWLRLCIRQSNTSAQINETVLLQPLVESDQSNMAYQIFHDVPNVVDSVSVREFTSWLTFTCGLSSVWKLAIVI